MKKYVPENAKMIPKEAKRVFKGIFYDVYHWEQEQFDGTYKTFEMLKHADVTYTFGIVDGKIAALYQLQPGWDRERLSVPGGVSEPGETPLESAQRETLEETGYTFKNWRLVEVTQGSERTEAYYYFFVAWDAHAQEPLRADPGEKIRPVLKTIQELRDEYEEGHDYRLAPLVLERVENIEELLELPEFHGREIEV